MCYYVLLDVIHMLLGGILMLLCIVSIVLGGIMFISVLLCGIRYYPYVNPMLLHVIRNY